jgi:hypothetical protein
MSTEELKRMKVVELLEAKQMTVAEGAALLELSERQLRRIVGRYRGAFITFSLPRLHYWDMVWLEQ